MELSRREALGLIGALVSAELLENTLAAASPSGPDSRMPLEEFVQDERRLSALRKGVRAMKKRKPSDPLSWFYQASIHGVTPEAVQKATADDPNVDKVFKKRYWNQCPHDGENSANFLPWHRGYTYYFERILRMHTEDDKFSLPYWNYTERGNRKFPKEFGIQHMDGNLSNNSEDNINPLYLPERDFYFTGYEHPFATGLPLLELTDSAVDISLSMNTAVFFGETEREGLGGGIADEDPSTRGLLESYPHDQIHRAVGGIIDSTSGTPAVGAMATPPTAGFDPIFSIHHSNIDRLWAQWSCMPGKSWGKLPPAYWFSERPWYFYDVDGKVRNDPRLTYFDHRALGIRFKYEDMSSKPLALPSPLPAPFEQLLTDTRFGVVGETQLGLEALPTQPAILHVPLALHQNLMGPVGALQAQPPAGARARVFVTLQNVQLGAVQSTGFDVHVTTNPNATLSRNERTFVGSITLFAHGSTPGGTAHAGHPGGSDESFEITRALSALGSTNLDGLSIVLVPYPLLTVPGKTTAILNNRSLRVEGVRFVVQQ
jgi:hypothetical protein